VRQGEERGGTSTLTKAMRTKSQGDVNGGGGRASCDELASFYRFCVAVTPPRCPSEILHCLFCLSVLPTRAQVVQVLLDAGADANYVAEALDAKTALHAACEGGHESVAAVLIRHMTPAAIESKTRGTGSTAVSDAGDEAK